MAIKVTCSCGREMSVKDELAGKRGKCPQCGKIIQVPTLEGPAAVPEPAPKPAPKAPEKTPTPAEPEVSTRRCVHCRKRIAAEAVFCIHCGTDLRTGKKLEGGEAKTEKEFDFFKVAPDMITRPMEAVGTIVEQPPSMQSFQKALIFFGIGLLLFTWIVPYNNANAVQFGFDPQGLSIWSFVLAFVLGIVCVITDAVVANVGGTMFGTTGTGFAQVFMAILAARALVGMALIVPGIYFLAAGKGTMPTVMLSASLVIQMGWGTFLMFCVIYRSYECGTVPAVMFAGATTIARALIFWLPSLFGINLLY